jgi:hypothetical protein
MYSLDNVHAWLRQFRHTGGDPIFNEQFDALKKEEIYAINYTISLPEPDDDERELKRAKHTIASEEWFVKWNGPRWTEWRPIPGLNYGNAYNIEAFREHWLDARIWHLRELADAHLTIQIHELEKQRLAA